MKDVSLLTTPRLLHLLLVSLFPPLCSLASHLEHSETNSWIGVLMRIRSFSQEQQQKHTPDISHTSGLKCIWSTTLNPRGIYMRNRQVDCLGSAQSSEAQVYLYVLSVLLLIYSSPNFTEQESVADIEYGSIDHSPECILSADWALRQMPSL